MNDSPTNARREVLWNLVLQYSGLGFMLVQGVVLVPVYLRFVGSAEFGVWLVAGGVATWLAIIDPGVATLMQQRISQALGGARVDEAVRLARRGLQLSLALATIVTAAGALASGWLLRLTDPQAQVVATTGWWLLFLSVAGVALGLIASYATAVGVALREARAHTIIAVASGLVGIVTTIALLVGGWGVLALPAGVVARGAVQAGGALRLVQIELRRLRAQSGGTPGDEGDAGTDGRALAWLALEKITGTLATSADLFMIGRVFGGDMVTTYALTRRPVDLLGSIFQRPAVALIPSVSFLAGGEHAARLGEVVAQASVRLLWLLGGAVLGTLLLLPALVAVWVGPAHYLGGHAAEILALSLAANVFAGWFANLYWASGATTNFCRLNSGLSVLAIAGMFLGLQLHGPAGLLIGALLPRLLLATWLFAWLALRALKIEAAAQRAMGREALVTLAALALGGGVALVLRRGADAAEWVQGAAGLVAYVGALVFFSDGLRRELRAQAGATAG